VLRIEGADFFVDLGSMDGVQAGDPVQVVRIVEVRTPEGQVLRDRFQVGQAVVVEVGEELTLIQGDPALRLHLQLGDVVITPDRAPPAIAPPTDPPAETPSGEPVVAAPDPAVEAFLDAFAQASASSDPAQRARTWDAFLRRHPDGATATLARQELQSLAALDAAEPGAAPAPEPELVAFADAVRVTDEDTVLSVVVTVPELARVTEGWLYYRREGEDSYRRVVLDQLGDTALVGRVPEAAVQPPAVEWFVSLNDWELGEVWVGSPSDPRSTEVRVGALAPEPERRSQVQLGYEFVNFYVGAPVDRWHAADADFTYRIDRSVLHRVGVGYGYTQGVGASVQDVREFGDAVETTPVGFKYGYLELELAFTPFVGLVMQGMGGVQLGGFDVGGALKVRLGREEGTNLLLGAQTLGDIGNVYEIELGWDTVERAPMRAGVYVTNQPGVSRSDYGVRLRYQVLYELTPQLSVGARVGYQLRNITHTGPSAGATAVFSW
jgi:hypothetical protein